MPRLHLVLHTILSVRLVSISFSLFYLVLTMIFHFFFFNDTATTEIYTLSLHDALPIATTARTTSASPAAARGLLTVPVTGRSEEHTSELQSHHDLVCRLLLEKKKNRNIHHHTPVNRQ